MVPETEETQTRSDTFDLDVSSFHDFRDTPSLRRVSWSCTSCRRTRGQSLPRLSFTEDVSVSVTHIKIRRRTTSKPPFARPDDPSPERSVTLVTNVSRVRVSRAE